MRVLIQRVKSASVAVSGKCISEIGPGLLLLVGIGKGDDSQDLEYLSGKICRMRIFEDDNGKMNLDILQVNGMILSVSQFTLYANTRKGNRPGFDEAAKPPVADEFWKRFNSMLRSNGIDVKEGEFGANMEVKLINDGPVTIMLDSKNR